MHTNYQKLKKFCVLFSIKSFISKQHMSKVLCLIDCLGSGGAERQMSYLAILLKERGHEVKLVPFTRTLKFYEKYLIDNGIIPEYNERGVNKFKRIIEIAKVGQRL